VLFDIVENETTRRLGGVVTDWEPMEISAVAIGADGLAQFRGDAKFECEVRG
jgi:hypothetical protein